MGNHDEIAAFGLPKPLPPWMSEGEAEHQRWTHNQLTQAQLEAVRYPQSCPKADEYPSRYTRNPSDYDGLGNLIDVTSVEPGHRPADPLPGSASAMFVCAREPASVHQSSNAARFSPIHSSKGSGSRPLASVTPD